jgi:hypothetical protein
MAINKTGISNSTRGVSSVPSNPNLVSQLDALKNQMVAARITDIVLDENHPKFNDVGQWNGIGAIFYELVNQSSTGGPTSFALPYDSQLKTYPLVNEIVLLISLPSQLLGKNSASKIPYYLKPLGIWNHPHHDAYPNLNLPSFKSQARDYVSSDQGVVRQVTDGSTDIELNSPTNPSQNTFVEKTNIHPLLPYMGDVLMEGRHGQSLRFGSTAKSKSAIKNQWSLSGMNGDPITILRNGQPNQVDDRGWIPINESIRNDLSSIYLTSTQKLEDFKVASELYNSYATPPIVPSLFTQPQIALTSNRIVINAKTDSILLSSQKSIGMSTNGSVNIDSKSFYISSNDIKLGSKNATEPVLKGDTTIELLKQLAKAVKDLATLLEVDKNWPGGNLQTGYNPVAGNVLLTLTAADGILAQLDNGSLKSQTTKVQ